MIIPVPLCSALPPLTRSFHTYVSSIADELTTNEAEAAIRCGHATDAINSTLLYST